MPMTAWKPEVLSGLPEGEPGIAVVQADPLLLKVCSAAGAIATKVNN